MVRDVMYYFDKKSPFERHELGEIQSDFNMGLTIDGSKDSMQVQVYNFNENVVEPNTILFHSATNTWWVVRNDKVKRYANEKDYFYTHNLSLLGAIDLLNSRDLTDCGFNDKKYTIDQFIKRLFQLSTFEFPIFINYGNNIDKDQIVNYVKSFENYTLLSAIREFLNGYNCDAKLEFSVDSQNKINWSYLRIIPKTGNVDLPIIDISEFDDVREDKNISKENYGTTAISNATNVISTLTKTYPQIGGVALNSNAYNVEPSNAFLQLPTPIYKINWLKMYHAVEAQCYITKVWVDQPETTIVAKSFKTLLDTDYVDNTFDEWAREIANAFPTSTSEYTQIYNNVLKLKDSFVEIMKLAGCITLRTGWKMNTKTRQFVAPENDPDFYFPRIEKIKLATTPLLTNALLLLGSKEDYQVATYKDRCMYYERGGDKIENFAWMSVAGSSYVANNVVTELVSYTGTDLRDRNAATPTRYVGYSGGLPVRLYLRLIPLTTDYSTTDDGRYLFNIPNITCQVNYIPMSDIKIKQDNKNDNFDSKLYNQNGKLNDSYAISKLLDSYAKEIQNETITRYMHYTNIDSIPNVGQLVNVDGDRYVINNISYDFYTNEQAELLETAPYYIECEFTLSHWVSTKSIMTSPNSNIRDYGIPQKYNVKRRQTYRDYYEFSLTQDTNANQETPYVALDKYLPFSRTEFANEYDHTAIIKLTYDNLVDNSYEWYYQLNTTAYVLDKSIYEIVDFNDNNIIGYDMQNTTSGFRMNDLWNHTYQAINTPISYTDDGGNVNGVYLAMLNKDKLLELYNELKGDRTYTNLVKHVFVGSEFYYGVAETQSITSWTTYAESSSGMIDNHTTVIVDINFENIIDANFDFDLTFSNPTLEYPIGSGTMLTGVEIYSVEKLNNTTYRLIVIDTDTSIMATTIATPALDLGFDVSFNKSGSGARANADYNIDEPNYKKDPIEVPVFEYSLQLGDNEQIEVGNQVFDIVSRHCDICGYETRNKYMVNKLNATKYYGTPSIVGQELENNDDFSYQYDITLAKSVVLSYDDSETIRVKFYNTQTETIYSDSEQKLYAEQSNTLGTQVSKSNLIGKDIIIYKSMITKLKYENSEFDTDYDNQLMFIIHNPQESNFDGDDLLVNINYYKLN